MVMRLTREDAVRVTLRFNKHDLSLYPQDTKENIITVSSRLIDRRMPFRDAEVRHHIFMLTMAEILSKHGSYSKLCTDDI
jgi:hypothetical protein